MNVSSQVIEQLPELRKRAEARRQDEEARRKRNRALRDSKTDTSDTIIEILPAVIKKTGDIGLTDLADILEEYGFSHSTVTCGVWSAVGSHIVNFKKDFVVSLDTKGIIDTDYI